MPLSKVALMCLDSSYLYADVFFSKNRKSDRIHRNKDFISFYETLRQHPDKFAKKVSLSIQIFDYILAHVRKDLMMIDVFQKEGSMSPEEKLFMTLRYLASGTSTRSLSAYFKMAPITAQKVVFSTLQAIWRRLSIIHLKEPTPSEMYSLASQFYEKWNFPNCIGSIGGKFVAFQKHDFGIRITNRKYRILKCRRSLVVNAVVDANFRFVAVDVISKKNQGTEDSFKDIFSKVGMRCLPGTDVMLPLVIIGNEAYPLKSYLMKPYPKRLALTDHGKAVFNNRIKYSRVPVDCAFEILAEKWQIYSKPFVQNLHNATLFIKVTCLLNNIIIDRDVESDPHFSKFGQMDNGPIYLNLVWRKTRKNNRASAIAVSIREQLEQYFVAQEQPRVDDIPTEVSQEDNMEQNEVEKI